MIYVFNKNKILSYMAACCFVLMFFIFQESIIPNNREVELIKVSSNVTENENKNHTNNGFLTK